VKASVGHVKDLPKSKIGVDPSRGSSRPTRSSRARRRSSRRSARRRRERDRLSSRPTPIARARRSPGTSPRRSRTSTQHPRVLINEITKKGVTEARSPSPRARRQQVRRAAGAPHPRSPGRLRDQPDPVEQGPARPVGRPRAVGRGPPRRRARGARSRRSFPRSTGRSTSPAARRRPPFEARLEAGRARRPSPRPGTGRGDRGRAPPRRRRLVVEKVERKERRKKPQAPFITSRCSRTPRASCASPPSARWRSRSGSTRASSSATRARRAHHLHAYGLDAHLRRRADGVRQLHRGRTATSTCRRRRTRTATRSARRTPTRRSGRRSMEWTPERVRRGARRRSTPRRQRAGRATKLYTLIWQRFVASQMVPAVYDQTAVDIERGAPSARERPGHEVRRLHQGLRGRRDRRRGGRGAEEQPTSCCRRSRSARRSTLER
jgi:hypothetical protein